MRIIRSPYFRRLVLAGAVVVLILGIGAYSYVTRARAAPLQPVAFPHSRMVPLGIQCTFCHTGATTSRVAGIPSVEKCMGCHNVIAKDRPAIQEIAGYWQRKEPIPWVRVNRLPDYVHFSHSVHVTKGLNCENCHGDVAGMTVTHQVAVQNMGWCLDCHNKQPNARDLRDCVICHY